MEDTRRMSVLTNIVYVLTDVLETNLLDMEEEYHRPKPLPHDAYLAPRYRRMTITQQAEAMGVSYKAVWDHLSPRGGYARREDRAKHRDPLPAPPAQTTDSTATQRP